MLPQPGNEWICLALFAVTGRSLRSVVMAGEGGKDAQRCCEDGDARDGDLNMVSNEHPWSTKNQRDEST